MEQIINKIRLVLFKHLEVQKLVEVMNEIRDELRETENTSNPVEAEVMQKIADIINDILQVGEDWADAGDYTKKYAAEYLAGYIKDKYK